MSRRAAFLLAALALTSACTDQPPQIISTALVENTRDDGSPYIVVAVIEDDREVERANVVLTATRTGADRVDLLVLMEPGEDSVFSAAIPPYPLGTAIAWHVTATDDAEQETIEARTHRFHVGNVPSKPELLTLWPNTGPSSGQTKVLLVGRDFRDDPSALFGNNLSTNTAFESRTQANTVTPPHPAGVVDVELINADGGRFVLPQAFTYFPAPEVLQVIPAQGPSSGGTDVEIRGRHFPLQGTRFLFAGVPATNVRVESETLAFATTPPGPPGFVTVRVEHDEKGFGERERAYEYIPPPIVEQVIPPRGSDLGGTSVIVRGKFFQSGAIVLFDGVSIGGVAISDTEIVAVTLPHAIGFVDVTVINPDDQRGTLEDGFFFFGPPIIDEVIAPYASADGGATVEIHGENFEVFSVVEVQIDGVFQVVPCQYVNELVLSCTLPASRTGPAGVRVTNSDGRFDQADEAIVFFDVIAVLPDRGPSSGGTNVVVQGEFLPVSAAISFGRALGVRCAHISESEIRCVTPPGPPNQFVDVSALPPELGQTPAIAEDAYFYVAPPEIVSIDPDQGPMHGGTVITIRGRFFQNGATVTVGGAACTNVVFVSDTELRCTVPPGSAGVATVTVTNPDTQSGSFVGFEYVPVTFTPSWALVDGFATITVRGTEFTPTARVRIGSQLVTDLTFVSPEELRGIVPSAERGNFEVRVEIAGKPNDVSLDRFSYRVYEDRSDFTMAGNGETSDLMIHDLDNDGDVDFVYLNGSVSQPGDPEIMENINGSFSSIPLAITDVSNEGNACDYNEDGLIDLIWGSSSHAARVMHNDGNLSFTAMTPPTAPDDSFETSFHDVTGDGLCDIVSLGILNEDTVLRNDNGTFRVVQNAVPHEKAFTHDHKLDTGDLDGDGDADMVVVVDDVNFGGPGQRNRIYLNNGNGSFEEDLVNRPLMESIHGDIYDVRIGDLDLDGDNDIILPNYHRAPSVLINNGAGEFALSTDRLDLTESGDSSMLLTDIEGDGDLDLYMINLDGPGFSGTSSRLFLNDGRGFFFRATRGEPQAPPATYRGAAEDIDGDGATDILMGVVFGSNVMYFAVE